MTGRVPGAVFEVSNTLGAGFLEKVYQSALLHELRLRGIRAAAEVSVPVTYKGHGLEEYFADILVLPQRLPTRRQPFPEIQGHPQIQRRAASLRG